MSTPTAPSTNGHDDPKRSALLADPAHAHLSAPGQSPYDSGASSRTGSESSLHVLKNQPGYTTPVFKDKEAQRNQVEKIVAAKVSFAPYISRSYLA